MGCLENKKKTNQSKFVLFIIWELSQFQNSKHTHILNLLFHIYRAEYWKGIVKRRTQWTVLLGSFICHGLNAFIIVTQLSISLSCVLQTVLPHTDPDQPCHYNLSHIFFLWVVLYWNVVSSTYCCRLRVWSKAWMEVGMESRNGRRTKKKEIADISSY